MLYVFEIEPTIEIPLLNADFFDRCLTVVTRHSTKRNPTEPAAMIRVYNLYRTYLNPAFLAHYDRVITRDGMAHVNNEIRNELVTSTKNHLALNYPRAVAKRIRLNYYLENLRIKKENAKRTQKVEFFSKENISDAVNDHFKSDEYKNMFNSRTVDKIKFGYRITFKIKEHCWRTFMHASECSKRILESLSLMSLSNTLPVNLLKFTTIYCKYFLFLCFALITILILKLFLVRNQRLNHNRSQMLISN